MPRARGANSKIYMAVETVYGTPPGGNWRLMPIINFDLGAEQPFIDADVIGVGTNRDVAPPFRDTVTVQGQAEVPVDLEYIGDWLRLLLGPPTTTGTSPNFQHVFVSGASSLPSNSIEQAMPDVPNYAVSSGVRADTWQIDFSPSGVATTTFNLIAQGATRSSTSSAGTPTTRNLVMFNKAQGVIRRNGAPLAEITGGQLSFSNSIEIVRTIRNDLRIEGADPGLSRATGQVTSRFADTTLLNDAINNTAIALEFEYNINANRRLTITLHQTYLALAKTPIQGPQGIEASIDFRCAFDSVAGRMMTVTLRNGVASYA